MKKFIFLLVSILLLGTSTVSTAQTPKKETVVDTIESIVETPAREALTQDQKDSILYSKLSAEQLLALESQRIEADSKEDMPLNGFGIVLIVMLPFLFVTTLVYLNVRRKNLESKRKYDLYMKSLEMGQTVPEHFFDAPKEERKGSNLSRGIISLMVGLAFGFFVLVQQRNDLPFLLATFIPGFVGIGYILIHFLEKPKKDSAVNNDEQNR